ncbi:MAG: hypothetical protein PHG85_03420 [Candidatus Altiarchaeota archaeon]|nr:hypothetical protein [Candidatus Altiarchaeota archaeon]
MVQKKIPHAPKHAVPRDPVGDFMAAREVAQKLGMPLEQVTPDVVARFKEASMLHPAGGLGGLKDLSVASRGKATVPAADMAVKLAAAAVRAVGVSSSDKTSIALAGVKPFEGLPKYGAPAKRQEVDFIFPDADLAAMQGIITGRNDPDSSIGWGLMKDGKMRLLVPQFDSVGVGYSHFDESGVIEEVKKGNVDSVFMLVTDLPGRLNAAELFKSGNAIREATGRNVPMYLASVTTPVEGTAKVLAFRFSPSADESMIQGVITKGSDAFEEFKRGSNVIAGMSGKAYSAANAEANVDSINAFTAEFLRRKTGSSDYAGRATEFLNGVKKDAISHDLSEKANVASLFYAMRAAEQVFYRSLYMDTGVMEGVDIKTPPAGVMPWKGAEPLSKAYNDLTENLTIDESSFGKMWMLASRVSEAGPDARILRPLAEAVSAGADLDHATVGALVKNLGLVGKCSRYRPLADENYDLDVSMMVARGAIREELWKRHPIEGLNTPDGINGSINTFLSHTHGGSPKAELDTVMKQITGRGLDELQKDDELMRVHSSPVAEFMHSVINAGITERGEAREQAEKALAEAQKMTGEQARKKIDEHNRRARRKDRIPVNDRTVAEYLQRTVHGASERAGSIAKQVEDDVAKLNDALKVTPGDETATMLETIAEGGRQELEDDERKWTAKRKPLDEKRTYDLFPGANEPARQAAFARSIAPVYPLNNPPAVEEAHVLIRDIACYARTVPRASGEGTLGGEIASAGIRFGSEEKTGLQAGLRLRAAEWHEKELTDKDMPPLARQNVLASHIFGEDSHESLSLRRIVEERLPPALRENYGRIESAYRTVLHVMPAGMK